MKNMHSGKRIAIYVLLTFALTYLYSFLLLPQLLAAATFAGTGTMLVGVVMIFPAISVILTRLFTKEGFRDAWIKPHFKGHIRYFLLACFGPTVLIILGAIIYFLVYPQQFDPNFGYLTSNLAAVGQVMEASAMPGYIIGQLLIAAVISPFINIIPCLGEELGWRGYLLPKLLEKFSIVPTMIISSIIWGIWHAPLIYLTGHNYGFDYWGYPWTGIAAMCVFCFALGVLFSYVSLKTRSCLPAALGHGAINGMAAISLMVMPANPTYNAFIGPIPTGILGGSALLLTAIILLFVMRRDEKAGKLIAPPLEKRQIKTADVNYYPLNEAQKQAADQVGK